MKQPSLDFELPLCSVDPITLTGLALAGIAGAGAGALISGASKSSTTPATTAPTDPTTAIQTPPTIAPSSAPIQQTQAAAKAKSNTPSFIGSTTAPTSVFGQKTLLGQ